MDEHKKAPPRLDKYGNPPPPRRTKETSDSPSRPPLLDKYGNPPPPRRAGPPTNQTPVIGKETPVIGKDRRPKLPTAGAAERRTTSRPLLTRPARVVPRRDLATFQPTYVNYRMEGIRGIGEWVAVILVSVIVALGVKAQVAEAFEIPSGSMENTLLIKDKVLVNKLSYKYGGVNYNDIVVFKSPPTEPDPNVKRLIKRVEGLPGDTLEAKNGILYRNGQPVKEPYLKPGSFTDQLPATTVPPGQLFMMGDNRNNSEDSRFIGTIPKGLLIGKAELRVWPLNRIGIL